ncbi:MAG TPA: hypothetical protein VF653_11465 [Methylomirabilota bacterium]
MNARNPPDRPALELRVQNHRALRFLFMALAGPALFAGGWWVATPRIPHDLFPDTLRTALTALRNPDIPAPKGYVLDYAYALPDGSLVAVFQPED